MSERRDNEDERVELDLLALPPVPAWAEEAWKEADKKIRSDRIRAGLRWWMDGDSWRKASAKVGLDVGGTTLVDAAKRWGVYGIAGRTDRLIQNQRDIALEADALLMERLRDKPQSFTPKDLNITKGVAIDKVLAHERNAGIFDVSRTAFEQIAEAIRDGTLEFKLEIASRSPEERAIDVTPEVSGG